MPSVEGRLELWQSYRLASINKEESASLAVFEKAAATFAANHPDSKEAAGFVATAELMKVESMTNLLVKLESFLKWKSELETSIANQPTDADLRLFRLSVQLHVPSILSYSGDIDEDSAMIWMALESGFWGLDSRHETFVREIFKTFELSPTHSKDEN